MHIKHVDTAELCSGSYNITHTLNKEQQHYRNNKQVHSDSHRAWPSRMPKTHARFQHVIFQSPPHFQPPPFAGIFIWLEQAEFISCNGQKIFKPAPSRRYLHTSNRHVKLILTPHTSPSHCTAGNCYVHTQGGYRTIKGKLSLML